MLVQGQPMRTIQWIGEQVKIIDQRTLPHKVTFATLSTVDDAIKSIAEMWVRGAPLIGVTAAYGMALAYQEIDKGSSKSLDQYAQELKDSRPTAVNLAWAVDRMLAETQDFQSALNLAQSIEEEEVQFSQKIGEYGVERIAEIFEKKNGERVNILTHCNAGWLACVDFGTATAPIYEAQKRGIDIHVWVDETRPRNQGASLTAWELGENNIPHTVIADNTGGHLMQHGMVDIVITGTDRTTRTGDVGNKIGTYLKALAAHDNNLPFYVALTSSAFDWELRDGVKEIPIETRDENEVKKIQGLHEGELIEVLLTPESSPALNYGFDVTPSRLVTGLMTERGVCPASEEGILKLFPEKA